MVNKILEIKNLSLEFFTYEGVLHVVEDLNIDINNGEIFGIVGESGCGKSVTSSIIMQLMANNANIVSGEVIFNGENILEKSEEELEKMRGKEISMIFQSPVTSLNPVFTIEEQMITIIMRHFGAIEKEQAVERAIKLLKLVELGDPERVLKSYPFELSGGMCQRVMIAMAISSKPKLLIADEPTTALDVTIQAQILELLRQLNKKLGMSILLITHDLGVIAEMCERVCVMYAGKVAAIGDVRSILKNPKHPYTIGLINSIPREEYKGQKIPSIAGGLPDYTNPPNGCRFHPRCDKVFERCLYDIPKMIKIEENYGVACWLFAGDEKEETILEKVKTQTIEKPSAIKDDVTNTKIFDLITKRSLSSAEIQQQLKKMGIKTSVKNINKRLNNLQKLNLIKQVSGKNEIEILEEKIKKLHDENIEMRKRLEETIEGGV